MIHCCAPYYYILSVLCSHLLASQPHTLFYLDLTLVLLHLFGYLCKPANVLPLSVFLNDAIHIAVARGTAVSRYFRPFTVRSNYVLSYIAMVSGAGDGTVKRETPRLCTCIMHQWRG